MMTISSLQFYEIVICQSNLEMVLLNYLNIELLDGNLGLLGDKLSSLMSFMVIAITSTVIIFSLSYMNQDPHFIRFVTYLNLFEVAMLILVKGNNLITLFIGWELIGLASFLLITFWFTRVTAIKSGLQAVVLNKIGDCGILVGICALYQIFGSINYEVLYSLIFWLEEKNYLDFAIYLLIIGALAKSGQFGLHNWLSNAMNAPTPVSALLHAATLVTAGVYLFARVSHCVTESDNACGLINILGGISVIFAGSIACVKNDLKSVIAFSTISQLGYMIAISGGNHFHLAMYHLFTHSFFKALLFLSSAALLYVWADEQDIRKLGGIKKSSLYLYTCFLIGTLTIIGFPFLSAYHSKDLILEVSNQQFTSFSNFTYLITSINIFLTSFYSCRLLILSFHWENRYYKSIVVATSNQLNWIFVCTLGFLAISSILSGYVFQHILLEDWRESIWIWKESVIEAHYLNNGVRWYQLSLITLGIAASFIQASYINSITVQIRHFLFFGWFYDEALHILGRRILNLGLSFLEVFDKGLIELLPVTNLNLTLQIKELYKNLKFSGKIFDYVSIIILVSFSALTLATLTSDWILDLRAVLIIIASFLFII